MTVVTKHGWTWIAHNKKYISTQIQCTSLQKSVQHEKQAFTSYSLTVRGDHQVWGHTPQDPTEITLLQPGHHHLAWAHHKLHLVQDDVVLNGHL